MVDDDKDKTLNLSYGDIVIPLIDAVQELSKQNNEMKEEIALKFWLKRNMLFELLKTKQFEDSIKAIEEKVKLL